jgi:PAS domain S-box-containing protein
MHATDNSIRVLLIEDNPGDVRLFREMVQEAKGRKIVLEHCVTLTQGLQALSKNDFNILLLDLTLPDSIGFDTFVKVHTQNPQIPIVVLTGTNDEELAIKSVRTGAQDYLIKGQIDSSLLSRSISYAIERAGLLRGVQQELIERKAMESMLRKVNRALRMLSECNEIVVRATDEKVFAEKICGAITEVGEYQFAWIAFIEPDRKSIQPIAIVCSTDYKSPEEASAWFKRDSDNLLSEALKTGKVIVCDDVTVDKRCSNLKTEADKLGYRSFIILPLVTGGKILGVMQLCSREPDRFDSEELKLLDELKEDIAYAIVSIRAEKDRRRAEEEIKMLARFPSENPSPVLRLDRDGTILYANEASSTILQNWHCSISECVPTFWREIIKDVLTSLEKKTVEMKIDERTFSLFIVPISEVGYVNLYGLEITDRKQVEEALRESQSLYHSFIEQLPNAVFRKDREGRYVMVNPQFCRLKGVKKEVFIGRKPMEVAASEIQEQGVEGQANKYANVGEDVHEQILQTGKTFETEEGYLHADGSIQYMYVVRMPVFDSHRTIIGTQGIMFDISERKQFEEKLKTSEVMYRRLFEAARDGILILDADTGMVVDVNPFLIKMLGYSRDQFLGKIIWELGFFKDNAANKLNFKELKQKKFIQYENMPLETAKGRLINVEFVSYVYQVDYHEVIQCNIRDITERIRAEEAVRSAKAFLDTVVDMSPFAMWISDNEGTLIRANHSLRDTINLTDDRIIGKYNVLKDVNLEIQGVMPMVKAVFEKHEPTRFSIPWKAADAGDIDFKGGRDMHIDVSMYPILNAQSELTNVVCQWIDITERKLAEEAVRLSEQQLKSYLDNAGDAIYILEIATGRIRSCNARACHDLGYNLDELLKLSATDIEAVLPSGKVAAIHHQLKSGEVRTIDGVHKRKDGTIFPVEIRLSSMAPVQPDLMVAMARDVTERKLTEEKLDVVQRHYQDLIANANIGILRSTPGPEGTFIDVNPAMVKMFEADSREQLMALHPSEIYWNASQRKILSDAIVAKGFAKEEIMYKTLKGKPLWCHINSVRKIDTNGEVYLDSTIEDVTERKRAEEKILSQLEELKRWQEVLLGREDRNRQLKHEVNELLVRLGETIRYPSQENGGIKDTSPSEGIQIE